MSDPVDPVSPSPEALPGTAPLAAPAGPVAQVAPPGPVPAASTPASAAPAWSALDQDARAVAGAGLASVGIIVVGGVIGAWPSTLFVALVVLAALVAVAATWFGAAAPAALEDAAPARIVTSLAASVVAVLGIWRLIELLFDLDDLDDVGGPVGAVMIALLAIAGGALFGAAQRRDRATYAAIRANDTSAQLALFGLLLVLLGWAINLASYWTMVQAAMTLTVLTLAALIIALAGRGLPPAAVWVGLLLTAFGALLAVDLFGQLSRLGETRLELGFTDYFPFLVYVIGLVIIAGAGVRRVMVNRPATEPPGAGAV